MLRITPTRELISRRFPVVSFAIRAPSRRPFEIALATDASLFGAPRSGARADSNFYTSCSRRWLVAPRGTAHYVLPPEVLARFVAARRLYYVLAVYDSPHAGRGSFSVVPGAPVPYLRLSADLSFRAPAQRAAGDATLS